MIMVIKIFASFSIISSVAVDIVVDDENQKYLSIELNNRIGMFKLLFLLWNMPIVIHG
jgi:D-alanine-D-alanine ligase-like ATP-grasp enzyme